MPLDPALLGHETAPQAAESTPQAIRHFAEAIGDSNPLWREQSAALRAGFAAIPAPPTFVTRFRIPFEEAGLDPLRMQVLHGEQEYRYTRPLLAGETLQVRHRVAGLRQSARAGGMTILTLEQLGDAPSGEHVLLGRATVIVREQAPAAAPSAPAKIVAAPQVPPGQRLPTLVKHVTQPQIDAYAEVSGDHNPIHVDPAAARAVGLDGTIAHGMLSMAFAGQVVTDWLSARAETGWWLRHLRVRFQGMVRPGDVLQCHGALGEGTDGAQPIELWIENQAGARVTSGEAEVAPIPR